jgi:hypothetical protein
MIEYGIILFLVKKERKLQEREIDNQKLKVQAWSNQKDLKFFESKKLPVVVEKVDGICLVILPVLFVLFNIIYWSIYIK